MESMENKIVRKSNKLIEAPHRLTLGEQRILYLLASAIHPDDTEFKSCCISIRDLAEIFNISYTTSLIDNVMASLRKLRVREFELYEDDLKESSGKNSRSTFGWIDNATYRDGEGVVEIKLAEELTPYYLQLRERFTGIPFKAIVFFRNHYSIRFYELLKAVMFKADAKGFFKREISYEELRKKFQIAEHEYKYFKDFRVYVIEPAIKEINASSDIKILKVEYKKTGRKITGVQFNCEKSKQGFLDLDSGSPYVHTIEMGKAEEIALPQEIQDLIGFGIAESTAIKWRKKYGIERIKRNIEYTASKQKLGKVRDPAGYLSRAIADDSASGWKNSEAKKKEEIHIKQVEATQTKAAEDQATAEKLELRKRLLSEFETMPEDEKTRLTELICAKSKTVKTDYIRHGVDGAMFRTNLVIQLKKERGIA
jgi:plasmid replication initiation protein